MTSETYAAYSLRTIAITEHQWITVAATSMLDKTDPSVRAAQAENSVVLHRSLANQPPMLLGQATTWREPEPEMKVTVHDTIVKQNLVTGEAVEEHELKPYVVLYQDLAPED